MEGRARRDLSSGSSAAGGRRKKEVRPWKSFQVYFNTFFIGQPGEEISINQGGDILNLPITREYIIVSREGERKERSWESLTKEEQQQSRIRRIDRIMQAAGYERTK